MNDARIEVKRRDGILPSKQELLFVFLLVVVTIGVYSQVWQFGFIKCWDDSIYVIDNILVNSGPTWAGIRCAFTTFYGSNWCPLTWLSLMVDAWLFKDWAGGYHLTNAALHELNVLLVFLFFSRTTRCVGPSAFVAALFAVHPLHVESVAWISERKDVLSMFLGLLSIVAYARYTRQGGKTAFAAALVLLLFSLMAKPTFVTMPFILLLLDFWPLDRFNFNLQDPSFAASRPSCGLRRLILEKVPFLTISVAISVAAFAAQSSHNTVRSFEQFPLGSRVANSMIAYLLYLKKAILPIDLAPFYPHPGSTFDLRDVGTACAILLALTLFALALANQRRYVLVGWFWFLGAMIPMIGLVQVGRQQMADRYAYLPLLGVYTAIAWLVPSLLPPRIARGRALPICSSVVVVAFALLAFRQTGYWRDGLTLMQYNFTVTRENAIGTRLLGDAIFWEGRRHEAIERYKRAIQLAPTEPAYRCHLGLAYQSVGQNEAAVEQFEAAAALDENDVRLPIALASGYIAVGRYPEAKQQLERARELDENNASIYVQSASLCRMIRDYPRSLAFCQRTLQLDERLPICHRIIAMNLRDQGRVDAAVQSLQEAEESTFIDDEARQLLAELKQLRSGSVAGN